MLNKLIISLNFGLLLLGTFLVFVDNDTFDRLHKRLLSAADSTDYEMETLNQVDIDQLGRFKYGEFQFTVYRFCSSVLFTTSVQQFCSADLQLTSLTFSVQLRTVMIKVLDPATQQTRIIVRGFQWANYHADIVENFER